MFGAHSGNQHHYHWTDSRSPIMRRRSSSSDSRLSTPIVQEGEQPPPAAALSSSDSGPDDNWVPTEEADGVHYLVVRCGQATPKNRHHMYALLDHMGDFFGEEGTDQKGRNNCLHIFFKFMT